MKFLLGKLISAFLVLSGVVLLIFTLFILFPSAEEIAAGQRSDASTLNAMRAEMGLDKSKSEQLILYLKDLSPLVVCKENPNYKGLTFSLYNDVQLYVKLPYLRKSYLSRKPVSDILSEAFVGSLVLAVFAMIIALILGIGAGVLSAIRPGSMVDRFCLAIATLGVSLPSFFLAVLFAWIFGYLLKSFTGLSMTGSLYSINPLNGEQYIDFRHIVLPSLALGIRPFAIIMQLTRSSLIDVMKQDYIRTARAKGLSEFSVIYKHALRNALNPVVTAASGWFASLLTGAFFIEYIFSWKGLGKVTIDALQQSDLPVVMGSVLLVALIFIVVNLIVDVLYVRLDPRVKLS
ncbi:MAG: ABC transporter permease [Bacteroidetes bacterium]|nr:ABC transporter permease [Bacteroidota bacterium]